MEASIRRPRRHMSRVREYLDSALNPNWRIMLLAIATWLLYEATTITTSVHNKSYFSHDILSITYSGLCFTALWVASRPRPPAVLLVALRRLPPFFTHRVWKHRIWRGIFIVSMVIGTWHTFNAQFADALRGNYYSDAIAFVHEDADLLRAGRNPFTADDAFWIAVKRWPSSLATPLFGSKAFGSNPYTYPSGKVMTRVLQQEVAHPNERDSHNFDPATVHNYPAGIIWLALPLAWAGLPSIVWLNLAFFALMIGIVASRAPRAMRLPLAVVLLANPALMINVMTMNFDVCCLAFVIAAWNWMRHECSSAVLIGVACAVKQLAWFIAPFYLLEVWRREGWQAALRRSVWVALGFLVPNLPFIIMSPSAWLHSIVVPLTDPMFPLGFGMITLGLSKAIPLGVPAMWTLLSLLLLLGFFVLQWRRRTITADGLLFALVPLWFAWRSPVNYLALLPVLAAWIAVSHYAHNTQQGATQQPSRTAFDHLLLGVAVAEEEQRELVSV